MEHRRSTSGSKPHSDALDWCIARYRNALEAVPISTRAFLRLRWSLVAHWVLLLVALIVQGVLTYWCYLLVDVSVSLMEVWVELARKHLELTL